MSKAEQVLKRTETGRTSEWVKYYISVSQILHFSESSTEYQSMMYMRSTPHSYEKGFK